MRKLSFEEITSKRLTKEQLSSIERFPIFALLDNIRSLNNVGSIFRTADAVRLSKLYLTGITGKPPRKEIDKTALGAVETVPWEFQENALPLINELKKNGIKLVILEHTSNSQPFWEVRYDFPVCLMVGNEVFGIQDQLIKSADMAVEIPMYGTKQSLNVTIAFGIVVYEMLNQYIKSCQSDFSNRNK
jgi:tRNA G18 (ribose-2'-O)-methylase SpoU